MLVFGDHREIADPRERLRHVAGELARAAAMPAGIDRHAKLVGALIEAGQLQQGVEDQAGSCEELSEFVYRLAYCVMRSWDSGFAETGALPPVPFPALPERVELKLPEGFAYYAVYPEAYIAAARRLKLNGPAVVIGIRSIGTTLGAVVAAALGAPHPVPVRPFGDPFARKVKLPDHALTDDAHYVIVDEGPGLSGSSFGAVADWLQDRGVPLERIAFLPSHGGDLGPNASDAHRARWQAAQRVPAEFDAMFLSARFGPLEQFSTGDPWERLKFFGRLDGAKVLLKFAGLGATGDRKLEMASALYGAGLSPEPFGLVHGFLVERWRDDALRLAAEDKPIDEIGHYIGTRAKLFPAGAGSGASIEDLAEMCRRNLSLVFGAGAARAPDRWSAPLRTLQLERVRTDDKLDREEWLRLPDGVLLKTDALDHHCAHDLIGCQDLAWDVAGAIVEFALDPDDAARLVEMTERAVGRSINRDLLAFYRPAYCCFRVGQARLWAEMCGDTGECARIHSRAILYETTIKPLLYDNYCCFTQQESLVD
jgi:hypothetical protein